MAVLSDGGLRRSEAAALTWGDVQRWDDGSGRITVVRSKTDTEAQGAVVAITPTAMRALDAIRPAGLFDYLKTPLVIPPKAGIQEVPATASV